MFVLYLCVCLLFCVFSCFSCPPGILFDSAIVGRGRSPSQRAAARSGPLQAMSSGEKKQSDKNGPRPWEICLFVCLLCVYIYIYIYICICIYIYIYIYAHTYSYTLIFNICISSSSYYRCLEMSSPFRILRASWGIISC